MTLQEKKEKYPNLYALAAELVRHKSGYAIAELIVKHCTNDGDEDSDIPFVKVLSVAEESSGN